MKTFKTFFHPGIYFILFLFPLSLLADHLNTSANTGSDEVSVVSVYEDITTTNGLSVNSGDRIMVIASFNSWPTATGGTQREVTYRITDGTNHSTEIIRQIDGGSLGQKAIGSLVHVFEYSASGNPSFTLQHKINEAIGTQTDASLLAIKLTTSQNQTLNNDFTSINTGVSTSSNTFEGVSGMETGEIHLPVTGGLFVTASVNSYKTSTGSSTDQGEWILQYKKRSDLNWSNLGYSVSRTIGSANDEGIISLLGVIENASRDHYIFRLAHRVSDGSTEIITDNSSLAALALAYEHSTAMEGRAFKTFLVEPGDQNTTSTTFVNAATEDLTTTSDKILLCSSSQMSADAASDGPGFQLQSTGLTAGNTFTLSFQHKSTSGVNLTNNDIIFAGFQLEDSRAAGYWTGAVSEAWNETGNWDDGVIPTAGTNVLITDQSNEPVIYSDATCNNLTIQEDATLSVNTGNSLSIYGDLMVESGGSFIGKGSVSLLNGEVRATRYMTKDIWHYISSPAGNVGIDAGFMQDNDVHRPDGVNYSFFRWDEPTNFWYMYGEAPFGDAYFQNGRGYIATFNSDSYVEFRGGLNEAPSYSQTIYSTPTSGRQGWNLVGNPYLSPLDLDTFTNSTNNPNIEGTVYFWSETTNWTHPNDNYAYWNSGGSIGNGTHEPDDQIAVAQGFMVKATAHNVNVNFTSDMRTHANPHFFKKEEDISRVILSVQYQDDFYNESLVALIEDATTGFDRDYDARKMLGDASLYMYTLMPQSDQALAIQGIPYPEDAAITLPLIIETNVSGEFAFVVKELQNLEERANVVLEDKLENKFYDLQQSENINLQLQEGINDERFYLHFESLAGIEDGMLSNSVYFYAHDNILYITDRSSKQGTIEVYDVHGRLMMKKQYKGETINFPLNNLPAGYYVVRIITEKGLKSEKINIH